MFDGGYGGANSSGALIASGAELCGTAQDGGYLFRCISVATYREEQGGSTLISENSIVGY